MKEVYLVETRKGDGFIEIGTVTLEGGKAILDFKEKEYLSGFNHFGPDRSVPEQGDEYVKWMILELSRNSGIFVSKL